MKKLFAFFYIVLLVFSCIFETNAFVQYENKSAKKPGTIKFTGFIDYAPFGYSEYTDKVYKGKFFTVFQPVIDNFINDNKSNDIKINYDIDETNYSNLIRKVREGKIDFVLGVYHQTELFKGLELIFPAMISNNITVFMLPNRVDEVKTLDDLKKLRGVRISKEYYTDFVEGKLKEYNIEKVDTEYDLFERLFTKKADYIIGSHYYVLIAAAKMGLTSQIVPAKQTLWQMPMFVGISKFSKHRKLIAQKLTRYLEKPENIEKIRQNLIRIVNKEQKKGQAIVPPVFEKNDK